MQSNPLQFLATLAPLQSAVQIDGAGNGMRIKLDIPETEMANALPLIGLRDVVLRVTVEAQERSE